MYDYALTESQFNQYQSDFQLISKVDKTTGAMIGAIWREILNNSDDVDLVFKIKGFVSRGTEIYALAKDNEFDEDFDFYSWLRQRITFAPELPLNPLHYVKIFGFGHLPEKLPYIISDIERKKEQELYQEPIKTQIKESMVDTPVQKEVFQDDAEEATAILFEGFYNLNGSGYKFNLYEDQTEKIIGRGNGVDFSFSEKYVSRNHARIKVDYEGLKIYDLGSSNGTKINGRKVPSHKWTLVQSGDILTIGRANLNVNFVEED